MVRPADAEAGGPAIVKLLSARGLAVVPRLARPAVPAVPPVLAPPPDWLARRSAPDGSVVAAPDHTIAVEYRGAHLFRLALDAVERERNGPYFQLTDPPSGSLRRQPPAPLALGAHTLATWHEDAEGRREMYTWEYYGQRWSGGRCRPSPIGRGRRARATGAVYRHGTLPAG